MDVFIRDSVNVEVEIAAPNIDSSRHIEPLLQRLCSYFNAKLS